MDFHLNMQSQFVAKIRAQLAAVSADIGLEHGVVAAISGGPDSTAMLLALNVISQEFGFPLIAGHYNHKMRGDESQLDEKFCRELCKRIEIPITVCEETEPCASPSEALLRARRYDFLFQVCRSTNCHSIVLAHTSDDQIETILFRQLRGTSPAGLSGMKPAQQMRNGLWLARPMLNTERKEVEMFLEKVGVSARTDATNQESRFSRNFLRNEVIPLCLKRFPAAKTQLRRLSDLAKVESNYLQIQTDSLIDELGGLDSDGWSRSRFASAHEALQRRALVEACKHRDIEHSYERVEAILNTMAASESNERFSLNEKYDLMLDRVFIRFIDMTNSTVEPIAMHPTEIVIPGRTMLLSLGAIVNVEDWQLGSVGSVDSFPSRTEFSAYVDLSAITAPLLVRSRREGDRITPLGMNQSVSLKKYLHVNKAGANQLCGDRRNCIVIADRDEVVWIPGVGLSEKLRVRTLPTHVISISAIGADFSIV